MKRMIAALLALSICLSMAACSSPKESETVDQGNVSNESDTKDTVSEEKSVAVIMQAGGLGDQGYNDNAKVGLDMMVEKYNLKGTLVEAPQPAEADTFIRQLANDGHQLIICLDWTIVDYVREASKDYPETYFLI